MADTVSQPERRRQDTVIDGATYLDGYRRPLTLATALFALGILVGLLGPAVLPAGDVLPGIKAGLPDLTVVGLFLNNFIVLAILLAGTVTLGVSSGVVLLVNGIVLGYVAAVIAANEGVLVAILGIVPHGILEIPAFLVGGAIAFKFGRRAVARFRSSRDRIATGKEYRVAAGLMLAAVGLLLVAAIIEVHVTELIVEALTG